MAKRMGEAAPANKRPETISGRQKSEGHTEGHTQAEGMLKEGYNPGN